MTEYTWRTTVLVSLLRFTLQATPVSSKLTDNNLQMMPPLFISRPFHSEASPGRAATVAWEMI
jgi:hypothetical protein